MYNYMERRLLSASLLIAILFFALSCGRVAPVHEPGQIQVTSTPDGAAVILDGEDTGLTTPATITDLAPGTYVVTVQLEGHVTSPSQEDVELSELELVALTYTLDATVGQLVVNSAPTGAAIWINGEDTGQITPATVDGVVAGTVMVSLVHPEVHFSPAEFSAEVVNGLQTEITSAAFTSRSRRTVLFEGFSNVECGGCPEMAADIEALMHDTEYSIDRVLYVKYSLWWPQPHDPFYDHNVPENTAQFNRYGGDFNIPTLINNGIMAGSGGLPPELDGMKPLVDAGTVSSADPGFLIDVTADLANFNFPVTVTLTPAVDVDLTGYLLHVLLVQSEIDFEETPYHWVFRDKATAVPALGTLTAGTAVEFGLDLNRNDWDLETMKVLAFVQHGTSLEILQAGATMITGTSGSAAAFLNVDNNDLNNRPGGN